MDDLAVPKTKYWCDIMKPSSTLYTNFKVENAKL